MLASALIGEVAGYMVYIADDSSVHSGSDHGGIRSVDRFLPHILQHHVHNEFVGLLQVVQR